MIFDAPRFGGPNYKYTLIRPLVTYGAETWTLTAAEENALRRFERKVLRKIYKLLFNIVET